ncbi:polyamine aminopropyltransferase [Silanimonas sp.]|uniref:polyamine aminopropyltransferase n=1 Tax=Silanimonas sp. TaxID=1929290 RepID=UPI001BC12DDA|nr:polyamine aminopropyltransferase [Silanimonas sp.]MBS3896851.1 polyamine aminopropyltransferase [Silanimonas sp.]
MNSPPTWLHETFDPTGSAFGLRVRAKLDEVQSPFQKIEIYESTDWGKVMLIDGAMMVTTRDNFFYHEMMAHAPLFTHAKPENVVIIGGGDCGTLREVLKHPGVRSAVQCDIDEQVTVMARKYFPELCESNDDPRATVMFDDGIAFMKNAAPESIDVVIVDSTDPVGPAEGLFNRAFYADCLRALKPGGLLVQQSESPLALMHLILDMRAAMRDAGFKDFRVLPFPQPCYPTGYWSALIASRESRDLRAFREADARAKSFPTEYYSAAVHQAALALPPFVEKALAE